MGFTHEGVIERLSSDPMYIEMFEAAWGQAPSNSRWLQNQSPVLKEQFWQVILLLTSTCLG